MPPLVTYWVVTIFLVLFASAVLAVFQGDFMAGVFVLAFAVALPGLTVFRDAHIDHVVLDRVTDMVELHHLSLRGRRRVRHPLAELSHAATQYRQSGVRREHRVALILDRGMDAGAHPVTANYCYGDGASQAVDAINRWLAQVVDSGIHRA